MSWRALSSIWSNRLTNCHRRLRDLTSASATTFGAKWKKMLVMRAVLVQLLQRIKHKRLMKKIAKRSQISDIILAMATPAAQHPSTGSRRLCRIAWSAYTSYKLNKQLSYCRETALQGGSVSGRWWVMAWVRQYSAPNVVGSRKLKALIFYTINPLWYEKRSLCVFEPLFGGLRGNVRCSS